MSPVLTVSFVRIEENKGVRMLGLASKRII